MNEKSCGEGGGREAGGEEGVKEGEEIQKLHGSVDCMGKRRIC